MRELEEAEKREEEEKRLAEEAKKAAEEAERRAAEERRLADERKGKEKEEELFESAEADICWNCRSRKIPCKRRRYVFIIIIFFRDG